MTPTTYSNLTIDELVHQVLLGTIPMVHHSFVLGILAAKVREQQETLANQKDEEIDSLEKELLGMESALAERDNTIYDLEQRVWELENQ
jgi:hypothetical protein